MNDPVLVVNKLAVRRETHLAVQDVSFEVQAGTDTAIIGPNGAGKSTLIQAVLGIFPRQSGEILVLGHPLAPKGSLPPTVRQQMAYLPQNFLFDRRIPITVSELVGLGWGQVGPQLPWGGGRSRHRAVQEALRQVEAWYLRDQLVSSLSGGETKRVLLAYCLVQPRRLLVLDEAPAGLDVRSESDFYQLLYQLKREQGWAILQVSHDLDMVRRSCDRVLCMNQTILCQGTPDHALTPENLSLAYGAEFVRYHHFC
ncbi:MAG: metal ABC transporter ATP-binding protein [Cyanothece sp. SIO2G6]|nr:metal ABC transporter ATP-binding protein [Cyanothece sp. SIO2G6]